MVAQATVLDDLSGVVGDKHAYPPDHSQRYAVDGVSPQAVVEPGTYEEVAAVLRYASEAGLAVIPLGGGMPINVGEETIGGVGLSGAPGGQEQEEACAKAGIAKVADQLK